MCRSAVVGPIESARQWVWCSYCPPRLRNSSEVCLAADTKLAPIKPTFLMSCVPIVSAFFCSRSANSARVMPPVGGVHAPARSSKMRPGFGCVLGGPACARVSEADRTCWPAGWQHARHLITPWHAANCMLAHLAAGLQQYQQLPQCPRALLQEKTLLLRSPAQSRSMGLCTQGR